MSNDLRKLHADLLWQTSRAERDVMRCKGSDPKDPIAAMTWASANERASVYKNLALRLEADDESLAKTGRAWREKVAQERAEAAVGSTK